MIGIVKYYIENRRTSRGIIVVVPLDGTKTISELKICKANLKRGEDVFDGDIVSFELERNDNKCLINNVTKAANDKVFLDILQDRSFQDNYVHIKNFIFNFDSYAYQNFKKAVSSLVSDELAEKEVVVWPELNPKKVETFIFKRYSGSNDHLDTYDYDKKLFEKVNAKKWFRLRYVSCIPKDILQDNRDMWEDLDEKTVKILLIQRLKTATKMDPMDLKWLAKYPELIDSLSGEVLENAPALWKRLSQTRIIEIITGSEECTQNRRNMLDNLFGRLPDNVIESEKSLWKFIPENRLEAIVKNHVNNQRILWDLDSLYLLNHPELFEQIPVNIIEKMPQLWDGLNDRQVQKLVRYHLKNNLTEHWEWDKGWIEKYPGLLELKREYLALIDEEFLNRIDREDLIIKYWQLCYEHAINKDKANKEIIKQEIKKRDIRHLYHFTRASNLESILNYGILPRTTLDNNSIKYEYNDAGRFDRCEDAVCTSIEFPNYRMFYKSRMSSPNTDWVVIELDSKILYESDCAFCWMNAGDSRISSVRIEERKTCTAFKELFDNRAGFHERDSRLNASDPTNPQAEVLIFSSIPVDYIKNIYFCDEDTAYKYISLVNILSKMAEKEMVHVWSYLFKYRVDYENWKNDSLG